MTRLTQSPVQETFCRCGITLHPQQKVDGVASGDANPDAGGQLRWRKGGQARANQSRHKSEAVLGNLWEIDWGKTI